MNGTSQDSNPRLHLLPAELGVLSAALVGVPMVAPLVGTGRGRPAGAAAPLQAAGWDPAALRRVAH